VLRHAGEFINITCFAPFMFISQSEVNYNTITPVVKKSYGLYFESKIERPVFFLFVVHVVQRVMWAWLDGTQCAVRFAARIVCRPLKDRVFDFFCCLADVTKHR
jgi:hypothetical protein